MTEQFYVILHAVYYLAVKLAPAFDMNSTSDKFSLLDVLQFGRKSYNNEGAYATLKHPDFEIPTFHTFKAVDKPKV